MIQANAGRTSPTLSFDHAYCLVPDLEAARRAVADLGFFLTARSDHVGRGTANHLAVFGTNYLELLAPVGPDVQATPLRKALLSGSRVHGIALSTRDLADSIARLHSRGIGTGPLLELSRSIEVAGEPRTLGFRVATVEIETPFEGQLFLCEHLTPQFIWRDEWQHHPNRVAHLAAVTITAPAPETLALALARIVGTTPRQDDFVHVVPNGATELRCLTASDFMRRYPGARAQGDRAGAAGLTFATLGDDRHAPPLRQCDEGRFAIVTALNDTVLAFSGADMT